MNTELINFLAAVVGSVGLFFMVGSLTGAFRNLRPGKSIDLEDDETIRLRLGLAARLARTLTDVLPFRRDSTSLPLRLSRAGNPFDSPEQFYNRKFVYLILFFGMALLGSILLGLPLALCLLGSVLAGVAGLYGPDSEIKERINKRRQALRREMAFMLDRVAFAVMAYGTFQEALSRMNQMSDKESRTSGRLPLGSILVADRSEKEQQRMRMVNLGTSVTGMGGGLFAEYLNRMGMLLSSAAERFDNIRMRLDASYPTSPELENFLDIVEAGLRGSPMAERLFELADAMMVDVEQEQREAGMRATAVVVLAAGIILVPLLLIVGGPAFSLAMNVFGG